MSQNMEIYFPGVKDGDMGRERIIHRNRDKENWDISGEVHIQLSVAELSPLHDFPLK